MPRRADVPARDLNVERGPHLKVRTSISLVYAQHPALPSIPERVAGRTPIRPR